MSCHNLFITYFTWTFFKHWFYIAEKIFELTNCENKSLRELLMFKYFCFESDFKKISNNVDLYNLYLPPNSISGICAVVSKIMSKYKEKWCIKICLKSHFNQISKFQNIEIKDEKY
jgi:hypothetical protein